MFWLAGRAREPRIQFEIFCGEFFEGSRPNPNAQAEPQTVHSGAVRIKSQSSRVRQHRASRATERVSPSVVWLSATLARHHGGHGRRPERRRDLHVRGAMARVRDELECECPSMTLLRPAAFLPARANPSPAPHSDPARSAADATLRTRPAVDRRAPRRDLTR